METFSLVLSSCQVNTNLDRDRSHAVQGYLHGDWGEFTVPDKHDSALMMRTNVWLLEVHGSHQKAQDRKTT